MDSKFLDKLTDKSIAKEKLTKKVKQNPNIIPEILKGISSPKPAI